MPGLLVHSLCRSARAAGSPQTPVQEDGLINMQSYFSTAAPNLHAFLSRNSIRIAKFLTECRHVRSLGHDSGQ